MSIPRLPLPISSPRIALACGILWATAFVSSTYFPQVFEAKGGTVIWAPYFDVSEVPGPSERCWD